MGAFTTASVLIAIFIIYTTRGLFGRTIPVLLSRAPGDYETKVHSSFHFLLPLLPLCSSSPDPMLHLLLLFMVCCCQSHCYSCAHVCCASPVTRLQGC